MPPLVVTQIDICTPILFSLLKPEAWLFGFLRPAKLDPITVINYCQLKEGP